MKNLFSKLKGKKGFTLVEMIVVMAIIGILVALLAPNVATLIKDAQDTSNDAKTKNVMTTLSAYNTKHIKDGYYFDTTAAGTAQNLDENTATDEYVLEVKASDIGDKIKALWLADDGTGTPAETTVPFIGGGDAYLPDNTLTGSDIMYLYFSSEGNVLGVAYVNAGDTIVKSVVGALTVSADAIAAPADSGWNNKSLRGTQTSDGINFS